MKIISTDELINYKILPYNIYSEFGEKIFAAGEVLTPGKLLQLRHMNILYRDDEIQPISMEQNVDVQIAAAEANVLKQIQESNAPSPTPKSTFNAPEKQAVVVEKFDMSPSNKIFKNKLSVDDIDIMSYKGPINKKAKIDPQTQIKIKAFYNKIMEMMEEKPPLEMLGMFANVRDKIIQDIIFENNEVFFCSQLKLLGEYNKCHALNTAIMGGALAKKMDLPENTISDIVLAGLLHDIGKSKIAPELLNKTNLTGQEQKLVQEHTKIGYKIIRNEMDLPENIAKVALEHHEHNDGSGYPAGKSGEKINIESQIISVCNYFDNITSNRTLFQIKNTKEALRVMLALGTKRFSAKALYTFVHMFSYNDTTNFEEMIL